MPAGITHLTLSRKALDYLNSVDGKTAKIYLNSEIGPYLVGSVGPDIPYMGNFDHVFWTKNDEVADSLHYDLTNKLPLEGLLEARNAFKANDKDLAISLFAFYIGYASHLIADGIIHPFVRDHVGDYKVAKTEHRALEMRLDVLVAKKFHGTEINGVSLQDDLEWMNESKNGDNIFASYSQLLKKIHGHELSVRKVKVLTDGMKTALDIAEVEMPDWYSAFGGKHAITYTNISKVLENEQEYTTVHLPKDAVEKNLKTNFMGTAFVSFFDHVVPKYFETFPPVIEAAYRYVFKDGPSIELLLPEINLDTGRLVKNQDLKQTPALWV